MSREGKRGGKGREGERGGGPGEQLNGQNGQRWPALQHSHDLTLRAVYIYMAAGTHQCVSRSLGAARSKSIFFFKIEKAIVHRNRVFHRGETSRGQNSVSFLLILITFTPLILSTDIWPRPNANSCGQPYRHF